MEKRPEKVSQPTGIKIPLHQLSEQTTSTPTVASSTFPPFVAGKIFQLPKRQAVPRVTIITPSPPKIRDEEKEEVVVNAPTSSPPVKALGPVYVPGVTEKYEVIMATPLEDVDPTKLGLPSGVVIKPASQVIVQSQPLYSSTPSQTRISGVFTEDRYRDTAAQPTSS